MSQQKLAEDTLRKLNNRREATNRLNIPSRNSPRTRFNNNRHNNNRDCGRGIRGRGREGIITTMVIEAESEDE